MPIDFGTAINDISDALLSKSIVRSIASNPIYTSMLIVFVLVLLVMFTFRDAEMDDSLLTVCLKLGFWAFLITCGIMFIHNKVLTNENMRDKSDVDYNKVAGDYVVLDQYTPVKPMGIQQSQNAPLPSNLPWNQNAFSHPQPTVNLQQQNNEMNQYPPRAPWLNNAGQMMDPNTGMPISQ
jgi:hypothetical protein